MSWISGKVGIVFPRLALVYLILMVGFLFGTLTMHFETWPYSILAEVNAFTKGSPNENSTLTEKLLADLGDWPLRSLVSWSTGVDRSLLREMTHPMLHPELDPPLIYMSEDVSSQPKALMTAFLFQDAVLSVILLDSSGEIRHRWNVTEEHFEANEPGVGAPITSDFVMTDDGSIITYVGNRRGLFRIGFDGELIWRIDGCFHHYLSLSDDGYVWVWGQAGAYSDQKKREAWNHIELLNKIDVRDGRVVKTIRLIDVMEKNLDRMDPFLSEKARPLATPEGWLKSDLWHPNDAEPLPASFADQFPDFAAGDLAICVRSQNLVFVMDPETLEIKWWSQGAVQGPHDVDWQPDGKLSILNNRRKNNGEDGMAQNYSAIQQFNFRDALPEKWLEGVDYNFITEYCGWYDVNDERHMLIVSSLQGRVFEVDPSGNVTMEFIHRYKADKAIWVGSARYVDSAILERANKEQ